MVYHTCLVSVLVKQSFTSFTVLLCQRPNYYDTNRITQELPYQRALWSCECFETLEEMLTFILSQGYIHNVQKGNIVFLQGSLSGSLRPIIIFRTSKKIASARLPKPDVDFAKASNNVHHVAPQIQWKALYCKWRTGGFKSPCSRQLITAIHKQPHPSDQN